MNRMLNLVSRPRPVATPNTSHQLRSAAASSVGVGAAHAHEGVERERPPELVEHHGLEQVGWAAGRCRRRAREGGEPLGEPAAAQFAGDERREHEDGRALERGEDARGGQRVAEDRRLQVADDRDEGREVHAPEAQVVAHGEVEEGVALQAVGVTASTTMCRRSLAAGHGGDDAGGERRDRAWSCTRRWRCVGGRMECAVSGGRLPHRERRPSRSPESWCS